MSRPSVFECMDELMDYLVQWKVSVPDDKKEAFYQGVYTCLTNNNIYSPSDMEGLEVSSLQRIPCSGSRALLNRIVKHIMQTKLAPHVPAVADTSSTFQSFVQACKKETAFVHVNLAEKIKDISLKDLPQQHWPKGAAVDALATEVQVLKTKKNIPNPFVAVDLHKFLPYWITQGSNGACADVEDDDKGDSALAQATSRLADAWGAPHKVNKKRLDILSWQVAFDKYAVAAHSCNQWSFGASMAHKEICLRIAFRATKEGRRQWLGVVYDEIARDMWANRARSGDPTFDINQVCLQEDSDILAEAKFLFDQEAQPQKDRKAFDKGNHSFDPKGKGKGKGKYSKGKFQDLKREREAGPDSAPAAKRPPY